MGYNINLKGKNKIIAEDLLFNITSLLENHKIEYCLEGGTLLGLYRENRLLPWDSDVDISIMSEEIQKLSPFLDDLKSKYRIRCRYIEKDETHFKKNSLRIIKIRRIRFFGLIKSSVCLEIFIKYIHDDKVYWKVGNKTMAAPKIYYEATKKINFLNKDYLIPLKTNEYLTHKYGDWQTPIKKWNAMENEGSIINDTNI
jgi:phosphorylcholine metabolism protein LicD